MKDKNNSKFHFDPVEDHWMSKKDAAKYTGLSKDTLDYHSLIVKDLRRVKLPGKVLFKKSEQDRWLESYADTTEPFDAEKLAQEALEKLREKMSRRNL